MSITSSEYLNQSRKKLLNGLGEKKDIYFAHMKRWFRMKITKEEFDSIARGLLTNESIHLHNEFLLAILTKCQLFSPSNTPTTTTSIKQEQSVLKSSEGSDDNYLVTPPYGSQKGISSILSSDRRKLKPKRRETLEIEGSLNVNLHEVVPPSSLYDPSVISSASAGYHSRCHHMLDTGPLEGRLLLAAWDCGLSGICDDVILLVHEASKQILKNILSAAISRRKGFRLREKKFKHSIGTTPPNPWLRNSTALIDWSSDSLGMPFGDGDSNRRPTWPTVDAAEQNAAQLASCGPAIDPVLQPLSAYDLFLTLQVDKSTIPCHSVYAMNMERISSRLWQPSWADMEQEAIYAKEQRLKEELRQLRMASSVNS